MFSFFFFDGSDTHRDLHSFPTRRSSDLSSPGATWTGRSSWPRRGPRSASRSPRPIRNRKSTRLNSSHLGISYAVFCLKKKNKIALSILLEPEGRVPDLFGPVAHGGG